MILKTLSSIIAVGNSNGDVHVASVESGKVERICSINLRRTFSMKLGDDTTTVSLNSD